MKVIILSGGWGTRLGKRTEIIPKLMIKIGIKPILQHFTKIYSHFGFNDYMNSLGANRELVQ